MNKPWVGYLSSLFLFFAGIFMALGQKYFIGAIFIVLSIISIIIRYYLIKFKK